VIRNNDIYLPIWADCIQYDEAKKREYFVREPNGKDDYIGYCWPGNVSYIDLLNTDVMDWYSTLHNYGQGKDFTTPNTWFWNDMNEPSSFHSIDGTFPKDVRHLNGLELRETHSIYGMLQSAGTYEGFLNRDPHIGQPAKRPFSLSRAWWAGSQRYAWVWSGDNTADWPYLRHSIANTLVSGMNGMAFIGSDTGGYFNSVSAELMVRWCQVACWTYPFFRTHCTNSVPHREPWCFTGDAYTQICDAIKQRYKLLAVWYTHSVHTLKTGRSPVVPLFFEWPEIDSFHDNDHDVLLGGCLLICPVLSSGATSVNVSIPPGLWYDFYNGTVVRGDFAKSVTMWDVPVFVRGGRIIPLYDTPSEGTFRTMSTPLTLLIAGDERGGSEGYFYMDDGLSYAYENGEYIHRRFRLENGILRSEKVNGESERAVPPALEHAYISAFTFYLMKPDGSVNVTQVTGLELSLKDEWTWRVYECIGGEYSKSSGNGRLKVISLVIGLVTGIFLVSVFIGILVRRMKIGKTGVPLKKELSNYV
jgi:alpha 1,3-glucosidase